MTQPNQGLTLNVVPGSYAICRWAPGTPVPPWVMHGEFFSVTRTPAELSVVCTAAALPPGVTGEGPWSMLAVRGPLDFSITGILAGLANPLSAAGISIFAISTYDTDYILVREDNLERAVRALREAGHTIADADEDDFIEAVKRGDTSAVANLLLKRPELVRFAGDYDKTGLHWAAETDHVEAARLLLDAGADIEAKTAWGATSLDWAATMGSERVAKLLLSRGATGFTLIVAAALGDLPAVEESVASGADLTAHRRRGAPDSPNDHWPADSAHIRRDILSDAMYGAARNGQVAVVEYLLDRGAAADAKGVFGATALHWAAINGHRATVDLLVRRGASRVIRDARHGATPADWAREGGHTHIAAALDPRTPA